MGFTLEVDNYRALRKVRWSPSGVCAVTGPNGSGKTTLLSVLEFLRHFLERGIQSAAELTGGAFGVRHQHASAGEFASLRLMILDWTWTTGLLPVAPALVATDLLSKRGEPEPVAAQDTVTGKARVGKLELPATGDSVLSEAMKLLPPSQRASLATLHGLVSGFRLYQYPTIESLRTTGSLVTADLSLHANGQNAFSVLRNWKAGRREDEQRFLFVREGLRECFPELFEDLEFLSAGQTVTVRLFFRGLREPVDASAAPHGLLVAMLHLCAIASAPDHGAIAIDELENGLHPFAIQTILELMRSRAQALDLTILLATHSPVVLNTFNTDPGRVYIMEPGHEVLPVPLDKHSNPEWLAHFALGDLYTNQSFGAQRRPPE
jgi:energy-coupling factor transporter ATP-binding protein EcfA2